MVHRPSWHRAQLPWRGREDSWCEHAPPKLQEGLACTPLSSLDWDQHLAIQTRPDSLHQQTDCLQVAPSLREAMGHGVGRQWDPGVKS